MGDPIYIPDPNSKGELDVYYPDYFLDGDDFKSILEQIMGFNK